MICAVTIVLLVASSTVTVIRAMTMGCLSRLIITITGVTPTPSGAIMLWITIFSQRTVTVTLTLRIAIPSGMTATATATATAVTLLPGFSVSS